jgi:hypothetical protein
VGQWQQQQSLCLWRDRLVFDDGFLPQSSFRLELQYNELGYSRQKLVGDAAPDLCFDSLEYGDTDFDADRDFNPDQNDDGNRDFDTDQDNDGDSHGNRHFFQDTHEYLYADF